VLEQDNMVSPNWDVAIIGAGPAGSTGALHLAQQGYAVLMLDQYQFPREKICGDGLIPDALEVLDRTGLYEQVRNKAHAVTGMRLYSPSAIDFKLNGSFLTIPRYDLDAILFNAARESGAAFRSEKVGAIHLENKGVRLILHNGETVSSRLAIVATGADVRLLDQLGMVERSSPSAVAVRRYVRSEYQLDDIIVSLDRSILPGYAWIFPMKGNSYNIGCGVMYKNGQNPGVNLAKALETFSSKFAVAAELMQSASDVEPLKGARLRWGLNGLNSPVHKRRIVAAGESLGATFPLTGEGIGKAMETAEIAAELIHNSLSTGDFSLMDHYPERLRALRPKYRGYQAAQSWVERPWYLDLLAKQCRKRSGLREKLEGVLNETVSPDEVFSWTGLIKLFFSSM